MNEHDLLDVIGDIDPKYIKNADKTVSKHSKTARFRRYYLAVAGLLLLVVAGIVIRSNPASPAYETIYKAGESTPSGAIPEETYGTDSIATEGSSAMLMYEGALYKDSGEEFTGEIYEDDLLKVSSYTDGEPSENGQQNFDRLSETKFFILSEDAIVVCIDANEGIWRIFLMQ